MIAKTGRNMFIQVIWARAHATRQKYSNTYTHHKDDDSFKIREYDS